MNRIQLNNLDIDDDTDNYYVYTLSDESRTQNQNILNRISRDDNYWGPQLGLNGEPILQVRSLKSNNFRFQNLSFLKTNQALQQRLKQSNLLPLPANNYPNTVKAVVYPPSVNQSNEDFNSKRTFGSKKSQGFGPSGFNRRVKPELYTNQQENLQFNSSDTNQTDEIKEPIIQNNIQQEQNKLIQKLKLEKADEYQLLMRIAENEKSINTLIDSCDQPQQQIRVETLEIQQQFLAKPQQSSIVKVSNQGSLQNSTSPVDVVINGRVFENGEAKESHLGKKPQSQTGSRKSTRVIEAVQYDRQFSKDQVEGAVECRPNHRQEGPLIINQITKPAMLKNEKSKQKMEQHKSMLQVHIQQPKSQQGIDQQAMLDFAVDSVIMSPVGLEKSANQSQRIVDSMLVQNNESQAQSNQQYSQYRKISTENSKEGQQSDEEGVDDQILASQIQSFKKNQRFYGQTQVDAKLESLNSKSSQKCQRDTKSPQVQSAFSTSMANANCGTDDLELNISDEMEKDSQGLMAAVEKLITQKLNTQESGSQNTVANNFFNNDESYAELTPLLKSTFNQPGKTKFLECKRNSVSRMEPSIVISPKQAHFPEQGLLRRVIVNGSDGQHQFYEVRENQIMNMSEQENYEQSIIGITCEGTSIKQIIHSGKYKLQQEKSPKQSIKMKLKVEGLQIQSGDQQVVTETSLRDVEYQEEVRDKFEDAQRNLLVSEQLKSFKFDNCIAGARSNSFLTSQKPSLEKHNALLKKQSEDRFMSRKSTQYLQDVEILSNPSRARIQSNNPLHGSFQFDQDSEKYLHPVRTDFDLEQQITVELSSHVSKQKQFIHNRLNKGSDGLISKISQQFKNATWHSKISSPKLYLLKMLSNQMMDDSLKHVSRESLSNQPLENHRNLDQRESTQQYFRQPRNVSQLSMMGRKSVSFFSNRVKRGAAGIGVSEYNHKSNGIIFQ